MSLEGLTTQTPTPLNRSTWNLKTLTTQLCKNNIIFVIIRVFFKIYEVLDFSKDFKKSSKFWRGWRGRLSGVGV
jgi:hypothetical protein